MKRFFGVLAIVCPLFLVSQPLPVNGNNAIEQGTNAILKSSSNSYSSPLSIGDVVPEIFLSNLLSFPSSSATLSSFKGKLLLLDFFATWCGACIKELPKLDSLQRKFKDRLQVVLVAYEPTATIEALRKKNRRFGEYTFPIITADTALHRLFPHKLLPHTVWIDAGGMVKAVTTSAYVTAPNIEALLQKGNLNLPLKKDALDYDRNLPLLLAGNGGGEEAVLFRSLLTKHLSGLPSSGGSSINSDSTVRRIYFINRPVLALYQSAIGQAFDNRVVLEVQDTALFIRPPGEPGWSKQHTFCYELTHPTTTPKAQVKAILKNDLDTHFNLWGRMVRRTVPCYLLVRDQKHFINESKDSLPLSAFVRACNTRVADGPLQPIIINEAGEGFVSNHLLALKGDFPAMKAALSTYGLELVPAQRELEVFVLSENGTSTANRELPLGIKTK